MKNRENGVHGVGMEKGGKVRGREGRNGVEWMEE